MFLVISDMIDVCVVRISPLLPKGRGGVRGTVAEITDEPCPRNHQQLLPAAEVFGS
jgi:hypothetical protein